MWSMIFDGSQTHTYKDVKDIDSIKAWCGQKILFGIWSRQRTPFTGRSDNLFHFAKTNIAVNWNLKFPWEQGWESTHWTFDFMNFSFEFRVKTEDYREQKRCNQCKDIKYARGLMHHTRKHRKSAKLHRRHNSGSEELVLVISQSGSPTPIYMASL